MEIPRRREFDALELRVAEKREKAYPVASAAINILQVTGWRRAAMRSSERKAAWRVRYLIGVGVGFIKTHSDPIFSSAHRILLTAETDDLETF